MSIPTIHPASEPPPPLVPRVWRLRLDPLLLLASLGLVACSLVALNTATDNDVPGSPDYYVLRQAAYAAVGLVLMYAVSRLDYSRLRELRYPIYGKTGTAERAPNPDQSWYAVYVEHPTRPIVVVTTVERGGFGAETAAPAACDILTRWFHLRDFTCQAGSSRTR